MPYFNDSLDPRTKVRRNTDEAKRLFRLPARVATAFIFAAASVAILATPATANGFDGLYQAKGVCQEVVTYQTALRDSAEYTISVPEGPGSVVAAFVTWIGPDDLTPNEASEITQADSTITVNDTGVVGVLPAGDAGFQELTSGSYWYSWAADIGPDGAGILSDQSAQEVTFSGWQVHPNDYYLGRTGAELSIVYDVSPCDDAVDIAISSGVDWVFSEFGQPESSTVTLPLTPSVDDRLATVQLSFWGAENRADLCRSSSLWAIAGSGEAPTADFALFEPHTKQPAVGINDAVEVVANPFESEQSPCKSELNPAPDAPYADGHLYPEGASGAPYYAVDLRRNAATPGAELTSLELDLNIPAGASWLALQLESEAESYGESGAWSFVFSSLSDPDRDGSVEISSRDASSSTVVTTPDTGSDQQTPTTEGPVVKGIVEEFEIGEESTSDTVVFEESSADSDPGNTDVAGSTLALTGTSSAVLGGLGTTLVLAGSVFLVATWKRRNTDEI